jgi:hypothetical protein
MPVGEYGTNGILHRVKHYHKCKTCGTEDPALLYRSRKMPRCVDCQHYENLSKKKTGGGVFFLLEEFLAWRKAPGNRICVYCGNDGERLFALGINNVRTSKRYEVVGVDRVDNSKPYTLENMMPCCGPCNAIRGGILSHEEMLSLSLAIKSIWSTRLS